MANAIVLGLLELIAIGSCGYGLYFLYFVGSSSLIGLLCNGLWFILGLISNICGVIALGYLQFGEEDDWIEQSQHFVQYHYLCAWLTIVVGYPSMVTFAWMAHYPTIFANFHFLLSVIPIMAWIRRKTTTIILSTQIVTSVAVISHAFISHLAGNFWGLVGAGLMVINVIALSLPTRYNLFGFSAREMYVIGLAVTSYIFCLAVGETTNNPTIVTSLNPFA